MFPDRDLDEGSSSSGRNYWPTCQDASRIPSEERRMAFKKGRNLQIYVASLVGYKQRSTGTSIPAEARKIERMCEALKDAQEWEVLDLVLSGRLTLRDLYAAYAGNTVPALKAAFATIDLASHLEGWGRWVRSNNGTPQTAATYLAQVSTLVGANFPATELTAPRISKWLAEIPNITTGTRRKYLYALKSFIRYLREVDVISSDPTAGLRAPKKNPARLRWETEPVDVAITNAAPQPYAALFALIKSTGAEVSAALAALRRDIDLDNGLVYIRGTKNDQRNRHDAIIEAWALPVLREHCKTLTPNAPLFPSISRYQAHYEHQAVCRALDVQDYTLRDSRHSWAVRCRKRGGSLEEIAAQLGHKGILMAATVYAVFKPTLQERGYPVPGNEQAIDARRYAADGVLHFAASR